MKTRGLFLAKLLLVSSALSAQSWGMLVDLYAVGNYDYNNVAEAGSGSLEINAGDVLGGIGIGYYFFDVISLRAPISIGSSILGTANFKDGKYQLTNTMKILKLKIGAELGVKLFDNGTINFILPLGFMLSLSEYEAKEPIKVTDVYNVDRTWRFSSGTVYSGIDFSIFFNETIAFYSFINAGYPVKSTMEFKLKAPSGYVWKQNGKEELVEEFAAKTFYVSLGIGLRIKLPEKLVIFP